MLLLTLGCESAVKAPISKIDPNPAPQAVPKITYTGRTTIVEPGDNLYSISFKSGYNYLDVAKWNEMDPEEIIYPGQTIKLYPPQDSTPTFVSDPLKEDVPKAQSKPSQAAPSTPITESTAAIVSDWVWPAQGNLIGKFSLAQRRNGIEIAGESGSPVRVAASGKVVYSGTGLIGYGRIIIVKHSTQFLSVYAHNSHVVVKEGDTVKQGQKIAEMGSTDADRVKLHFEIRRNGKPVDPLSYLPRA